MLTSGQDWTDRVNMRCNQSPSQFAHFWQSCLQGNALLKPKGCCNILSALVWAANGARWWWTGHKHPMGSCWSAGGNNTQATHLESCSGQSTRGSKDCSFITYPIPDTALWFTPLIWNSLHECLSGLGSRGLAMLHWFFIKLPQGVTGYQIHCSCQGMITGELSS